MSPIKSPNYTQVPNDLFDEFMPDLKEAELRIALAVCRLTFGYHRDVVRASITTLEKITGLSRQGVLNGAEGLEGRGLLLRTKDEGVTEWELIVSDDGSQPGGLVNVVDQQTGQLVNVVDQVSQPSRLPSIKEILNKKDSNKRPRNEFRAPVPENPTGDPYPSLSGESQPTVSEKPAGGKPDSSKRSAAPPEKLSNLYPIALALAEVAGMDFLKNKGRLFKEAKTYYQEGDDQRIRREYGPGGDWYLCDWRGRLAQFPTLSHIRETWGILKPPPPQQPNGKSQPNQQEAIRSIYRDI